MAGLSAGMSGLSLDGEVDRLRQENRELKRQLGGGGVKPSLNIPWEDLDLGDQISGGGFSVVYRCEAFSLTAEWESLPHSRPWAAGSTP